MNFSGSAESRGIRYTITEPLAGAFNTVPLTVTRRARLASMSMLLRVPPAANSRGVALPRSGAFELLVSGQGDDGSGAVGARRSVFGADKSIALCRQTIAAGFNVFEDEVALGIAGGSKFRRGAVVRVSAAGVLRFAEREMGFLDRLAAGRVQHPAG